MLLLGGKTWPWTKAGERSRSHRDRKSTRLNSSHLVISYAVFCLKKKKKKYKNVLSHEDESQTYSVTATASLATSLQSAASYSFSDQSSSPLAASARSEYWLSLESR